MKSVATRLCALAPALLSACVLFATATTPAAQWDDIAYDPAFPVIEDGFIVVHENALGINAFSAASRKWTTVSPTGSFILGVGDWTMLTREPSGLYSGYSSRRNDSATIAVSSVLTTMVHDDVILIVDSTATGVVAHGYSAVQNAWSTIPLLTPPTSADIAISRFVIAIRDKNLYHGFAARPGTWSTLTLVDSGDVPAADGNTVLVDLLDPTGLGGIPSMAAFSGIRGIWAISPPYSFPPARLLDHNVASVHIRTAAPGLESLSAYTACDAAWVTSPVLHAPGFYTDAISDNVVVVSDADPAIALEAFGARPALWATLSGAVSVTIHDEDYVVAHRASHLEIYGFSGVCTGAWIPEPTPSGVPSFPVGTPDHMISLTEGPILHSFHPAMSFWDAPIGVPAGSVITGEDALTDIRGGSFRGDASRWTGWTGGPVAPAAPFSVTSGGAVIAHQQTAGPGVNDIYVFDERCDMWAPPFNAGLPTTLSAGRNLLISDPGAAFAAPVHGYSVQRGDWTTPGPIATPLAIAPTTEENVALLVDGGGRLWGFSSANIGQVFWAWPNGTEYHVSGTIAGTGVIPRFGYSIEGTPGVTGSYALISPGKVPPAILLPYLGFYCIDLTLFFNLGFFGVTDPDCVRQKLKPIPNPLPPCLQLWTQPLTFDFGAGTFAWEHRCDPGWFF